MPVATQQVGHQLQSHQFGYSGASTNGVSTGGQAVSGLTAPMGPSAAVTAALQALSLAAVGQQQQLPSQSGASAAAVADLASRLKAAGDWRGAAEKYYDALRIDPNLYAAQYNLGALFLAAGDLVRALEHTERAYTLEPRSSDAMHNLGEICRAQGSLETAIQWYKAALRLNPNCDSTHQNLSVALVSLGLQVKAQDAKGAIKCYQEALVHNPTSASAYYNLGVSYAELRKQTKALVNYNLAVHFNPRCAEAYNNMGVIYKEQENIEKALKCYHMALQCNPWFTQTLNNLGVTYTTTGRLTEALEYLSRAVTVAPNYAEAYNNLGWLFWDHGDMAQALRMYERCIQLSPSAKNPSQNRLLALNYLHDVSPEKVFEAHRTWGERFCMELGPPFTDWLVTRTPRRRLRIGYVSPDFFHHSVSFFCHALLEHRNRDFFDVVLYSNTMREDEKTELFKTLVGEGNWKKIVGQSAREVANMIREDRIDILIELAGHTANNRLDVAALKPAPVQFTYIGYNNTTGLGAIDYRITDGVVDPVETEQPFSEELVRLPGCFLCYTPPAHIPDIDQLPAYREGFVTFGSFSCLAKIGAPCVALWSRVLRECPGSRLLVKNKGFYSQDVQAQFISQFEAHGISKHRLKLLSLAPAAFDHLKIYNEVDIALDTFPYSNTTTTCETLLMGVPAVCLKGKTHGSRVGVTLLTAVGLQDLIADTHDEYVQKAKTLANDTATLSTLRQNLRQVLTSSPLCDGPGFVRDKYEPMLLEKWRHFCEGRPPSIQTFANPDQPPDPLAPGPFSPPLPAGVPLVQAASMGANHAVAASSVVASGVGAALPVVSSHVAPLPTGAQMQQPTLPTLSPTSHGSGGVAALPTGSNVSSALPTSATSTVHPGFVTSTPLASTIIAGSAAGACGANPAAVNTSLAHPASTSYTRSVMQGLSTGALNGWQTTVPMQIMVPSCGSSGDLPNMPGASPGRRRPRARAPRIRA